MEFLKHKRIEDPAAIKAARRIRCELCGDTWGCQVHHIIPRGRHGHGDDTPENLITLCCRCHTDAHSGKLTKKMIRERRKNNDSDY